MKEFRTFIGLTKEQADAVWDVAERLKKILCASEVIVDQYQIQARRSNGERCEVRVNANFKEKFPNLVVGKEFAKKGDGFLVKLVIEGQLTYALIDEGGLPAPYLTHQVIKNQVVRTATLFLAPLINELIDLALEGGVASQTTPLPRIKFEKKKVKPLALIGEGKTSHTENGQVSAQTDEVFEAVPLTDEELAALGDGEIDLLPGEKIADLKEEMAGLTDEELENRFTPQRKKEE